MMPLLGGRRAVRRLLPATTLAALAMLLTAGIAGAHEHRHVADDHYEMVVGFLNEPAVQNQLNGLSVRVNVHDEDAAEDAPAVGVEGLAGTLQAEVTFGGQTMPLTLEPAYNDPGHYEAFFIPTGVGAYTFRIFGAIDGNQIDETFTAGPETFSEVAPSDNLLFPKVAGSIADATAAAQDAQDSADSANTLAIVGLVVGAAGLIFGLAGLGMAMQARKPQSAQSATRSFED